MILDGASVTSVRSQLPFAMLEQRRFDGRIVELLRQRPAQSGSLRLLEVALDARMPTNWPIRL